MTKIIVGYSSMCKVGGDNVVHFFFYFITQLLGKLGHTHSSYLIFGGFLKRLWNCVFIGKLFWYIFLELGLHPFCVVFIRKKEQTAGDEPPSYKC